MKTFEDAHLYILNLYNQTPKSVLANERAALNKAAFYYDTSLNKISADLNEFVKRWGRGPVKFCPRRFDSLGQFIAWRKNAKSALVRYWNSQNPNQQSKASLLPDWKFLIKYVKENGGVNRPLAPHLEYSIGAIGRAASASGICIADLNSEQAQQLIDGLKGAAKRSARLGIDRINDLIDRRDEFIEISKFLPTNKIKIYKKQPHPADIFARSSGSPLASQLWIDYADFVLARRGVDALGRPIPPSFSKFGDVTEQTYANTIQQVIRVLINFGYLSASESLCLRDICNAKMIDTFARCWNTRQIDGEVNIGGHNYYSMVSRLKIMTVHLGADEEEIKKIKEILKKIKDASPDFRKMSINREMFLRNFLEDSVFQTKLFRSPEILKKRSQQILNNWSNSTQKERMLAMKMGLGACVNAILYRSSPVRAKNLNSLKFRGDQRHLFIKDDDLRISIPGNEVKNNKPINHEADDDAAPIIKWYIEFIRPKLIQDHPYGIKLCDSDFLFPSTVDERPLESTTFADHYSDGIGVIGLDLNLHIARHICATIILWEDPNAWSQAAQVLEDEISTVKKFYAFLSEMRASKQGREKLQTFVKRARGFRKGMHDDNV
nr:hypothetical protein [uncultured Cohaesibacter sp.]